jgi:hypothetical protein
MVINNTKAVETSIHAVSPELMVLALTKVGLVSGAATTGSAGTTVAAIAAGAATGISAAGMLEALDASSWAKTEVVVRANKTQTQAKASETKRMNAPHKLVHES